MVKRKATKRETYPVSSTVLLVVGEDGRIKLTDPSTPSAAGTEVILFKNKFFKSDFTKYLKDNMLFKKIMPSFLPALLGVNYSLTTANNQDPSTFPDGSEYLEGYNPERDTTGVKRVDLEMLKELEKVIFPYLHITIQIQDDILYRNDLLSAMLDDKVNFKNLGADNMEVIVSADSKITDYVDLNKVWIDQNFQIGGGGVALNPAGDANVNGKIIYGWGRKQFTYGKEFGEIIIPLQIKLQGIIVQYKGTLKKVK